MFLLRLSNDSMEQTHMYNLFLPGRYALSAVDDVVVAHSLNDKVCISLFHPVSFTMIISR